MKIKYKIKFIFFVIFLTLVFLTISAEARYVINKNQTITISSEPCDLNITIDKTTATISEENGSANFKITISNNNTYPITYSVEIASSTYIVSGGVTNITLDANTTKDITVVAGIDSDTGNTETSGNAIVTVNVIEPYEKESEIFNLEIKTLITYDLAETIFSKNTVKTATTGMFKNNVTDAANSGLFTMEDESGTSYYFRGVIDNNYVSFAGKLWRIMRINGDGSYRLVLDSVIGQSYFNEADSSTYNNVGYMYGTAEEVVGTNSSTIKTYLEDWYTANLESYDEYIDKDAIFWVDREYYTTVSGVDYYKGEERVMKYSPSIKPANKDDMYSVTDKKGNGLLSKPIGLLTIDEIMLAGGKLDVSEAGATGTHVANQAYYICSSDISFYGFWTLTPRRYQQGSGFNLVGVSKPHAVMYSESPNTRERDVKPVINLKSSVRIQGLGTKDSPYLIKSVE